ncbi:hypothetical protein BH10PSE7_BH10PSE7_14090 [soil metagenome]
MNNVEAEISVRSDVRVGAAHGGDSFTVRVSSVLRNIKPDQILMETAHLADSGFSSLDMVRVMLDIEAEFDLMIPQSEINPENFMSVASIAALMRRLPSG